MLDYLSINDFLSTLQAFATDGFKMPKVHDYLQSAQLKPEEIETYISFRPDRYTRNLIYKDEAFELLVICWGIGQSAPIHGHEGERCWSRVERGTLRFTNYREVSEAPLVLNKIGEPVIGEQGHLDGPATIHKVENLASFGQAATSLHLYSSPFPECDIYDLPNREKRRLTLTYDTMYGRPVSPVS